VQATPNLRLYNSIQWGRIERCPLRGALLPTTPKSKHPPLRRRPSSHRTLLDSANLPILLISSDPKRPMPRLPCKL